MLHVGFSQNISLLDQSRLLPVTTGFWQGKTESQKIESILRAMCCKGTAEPFRDPWRLAACMCTVHLYWSNSASHKKPYSKFINLQHAFQHSLHFFFFIQLLRPHTRQHITKLVRYLTHSQAKLSQPDSKSFHLEQYVSTTCPYPSHFTAR